ncbi:hypothetical protein [Flavobacterium sp.]|jgi:hypothetical protein|uniref:hypothetical protein n=1 Tax=Flavobacterium sp. TaxID=239 RepID=UPI0037C01174
MFGAIINVIVSLCAAASKYAKALEASGDMVNRVVTVADKHVQNWELEQDQKIQAAKALVLENKKPK